MNTLLSAEELWPDKFPNSFQNRANRIIKYLKTQNLEGLRIADCGVYNPMARQVENMLGQKINSLDWNFDYPIKSVQSYDVILCFEVLEHLFNPLIFLESIKAMLYYNLV